MKKFIGIYFLLLLVGCNDLNDSNFETCYLQEGNLSSKIYAGAYIDTSRDYYVFEDSILGWRENLTNSVPTDTLWLINNYTINEDSSFQFVKVLVDDDNEDTLAFFEGTYSIRKAKGENRYYIYNNIKGEKFTDSSNKYIDTLKLLDNLGFRDDYFILDADSSCIIIAYDELNESKHCLGDYQERIIVYNFCRR